MTMTTDQTINNFSKIAVIIGLIALTQSLLAMAGIFTIVQTSHERIIFCLIELATMVLVIINSIAIMKFTGQLHNPLAYSISRLCLYSLLLCFIGDIVNRNFLQQFYQYDDLIKHSYLADSVIFFFPGYLILVVAIAKLAIVKGLPKTIIILSAILAAIVATFTYNDMHLAGSSIPLTIMTSCYSVLVSILAVSAIWLVKSFAWKNAPIRIWLAALGLVLAMIADAVIGKFWIFGNQGQGYFPTVSHINWIIYLSSQLLIQQLPLGMLQAKK